MAIDRAFMNEIKNGFKLEQQTEKQRVAQAAKEAQHLKGTTHPTLGKPVATIPAREFSDLHRSMVKRLCILKNF